MSLIHLRATCGGMRTMKTVFGRLILLSLLSATALASDLSDDTYSRWVDEDGRITLPRDFRSQWIHLGSWLVDDAAAPGYGLHDVYTQQESVAYYRAKGEFPDGAILVKEVRAVASGPKTTGHAQWAGNPLIWFVMVKDATQRRFQGSPHWGLGWGWSLYEAADPGKNVSTGHQASYLACHTPAKETDWVFIEGYPTLLNPGSP